MKLSVASSRMAAASVCILCRDHAVYSVWSKDDRARVNLCERHAKTLDDADSIKEGSAFRLDGGGQ